MNANANRDKIEVDIEDGQILLSVSDSEDLAVVRLTRREVRVLTYILNDAVVELAPPGVPPW